MGYGFAERRAGGDRRRATRHDGNGGAAMIPEQHRRECEAREWLSRGYRTPTTVADLKRRIAAKRGERAADELVEEMRRQWRR